NILGPIFRDQTTPPDQLQREPDHIRFITPTSDEERVAVAQELAYPGWRVRVDDENAKLESVGGLLGVILPPDSQPHDVEFVYRPVWLFRGAVISVLTLIFCMLYILHLARRIPENYE
ncbi:MAG TPA: hypothetical protein VJZ27_18775, partial [Aggregatilineales bacterium]|nr:hypothetical protein [Aggregatilineales bacterium]